MSEKDWKLLVERYACGQEICNCRGAYYKTDGEYLKNGQTFYDGKYCRGGCSSNLIFAKEYIAEKVIEELEKHK